MIEFTVTRSLIGMSSSAFTKEELGSMFSTLVFTLRSSGGMS